MCFRSDLRFENFTPFPLRYGYFLGISENFPSSICGLDLSGSRLVSGMNPGCSADAPFYSLHA